MPERRATSSSAAVRAPWCSPGSRRAARCPHRARRAGSTSRCAGMNPTNSSAPSTTAIDDSVCLTAFRATASCGDSGPTAGGSASITDSIVAPPSAANRLSMGTTPISLRPSRTATSSALSKTCPASAPRPARRCPRTPRSAPWRSPSRPPVQADRSSSGRPCGDSRAGAGRLGADSVLAWPRPPDGDCRRLIPPDRRR